ncbi:MAG: hypothetical protein ACJATE_001867 [Bacteroidia bacterium]|jgi:hypothetical protein
MRILALVLSAVLPFSVLAQKKGELSWPAMELDPSTNLITYLGVPEVAGATAADLYDRAFKWGQDYYKNFGEKLRTQDKEGGEIEIFARFPIFAYDKKGEKTVSRQGLAQYTLTIRFRAGRYKYTLTDLNLKSQSYQPLEAWLDREDTNATNHSYYMTDVDAEITATLKSMTEAIATDAEKATDDW